MSLCFCYVQILINTMVTFQEVFVFTIGFLGNTSNLMNMAPFCY